MNKHKYAMDKHKRPIKFVIERNRNRKDLFSRTLVPMIEIFTCLECMIQTVKNIRTFFF